MPHRGDPARDGGAARRISRYPKVSARTACPTARWTSSPSATGTPRARCSSWPRERPELARPIAPDRPDLLAEAVVAARFEQARSVADVLLRRTRLGILAAPELRSAESVTPVAEAIGSELGWRGRRVRKEAEAWLEAARAEGVDPAAAVE